MKRIFVAALALLVSGAALADGPVAPPGLSRQRNLSDLPSPSTARTNLGLGTAATAPIGVSGPAVPMLNGVNTWSGAQTFSVPTTTAGITDSVGVTTPQIGIGGFGSPNYTAGSAFTLAPVYFNGSWTGTSTAGTLGNYTPLFAYINSSDAVVSNTTNSGTADIFINNVVKPGHQGNSAGIAVQQTVVGTSSVGSEYFAFAGSTSISANLGGTSGAPAGHAYAGNWSVGVYAGGTYLQMASISENAIQVAAGLGLQDKFGAYFAERAADAAQGTANDEALAIWNFAPIASTPSGGWLCGLCFGATTHNFPIATNGTLLKAVAGTGLGGGVADPALTIGSVVDVSAIGTVSNYYWNSANWTVSGAGVSWQAGALQVGTSGSVNASDLIEVKAVQNSVASLTVWNGNGGTSAQSVIYLGNSAASQMGVISLNGSGNTTGGPAGAMTIKGNAGLYFMYAGTMAEQIISGGDVVIGNGTGLTASATAGFLHLPFVGGTPTGTPTTVDGNACLMNTSSQAINCYISSSWYHIALISGAG